MTDLEDALQNIFARDDPESLIGLGAPASEYMPEARKVAAQLSANDSLEQIKIIILAVFHPQFDMHYLFEKSPDSGESQKVLVREVGVPPGREEIIQAVSSEVYLLSKNDSQSNSRPDHPDSTI